MAGQSTKSSTADGGVSPEDVKAATRVTRAMGMSMEDGKRWMGAEFGEMWAAFRALQQRGWVSRFMGYQLRPLHESKVKEEVDLRKVLRRHRVNVMPNHAQDLIEELGQWKNHQAPKNMTMVFESTDLDGVSHEWEMDGTETWSRVVEELRAVRAERDEARAELSRLKGQAKMANRELRAEIQRTRTTPKDKFTSVATVLQGISARSKEEKLKIAELEREYKMMRRSTTAAERERIRRATLGDKYESFFASIFSGSDVSFDYRDGDASFAAGVGKENVQSR